MSILQVDFEGKVQLSSSNGKKKEETLKIPGGRYEQRPESATITLVGKDPSNFSSALSKQNISAKGISNQQ